VHPALAGLIVVSPEGSASEQAPLNWLLLDIDTVIVTSATFPLVESGALYEVGEGGLIATFGGAIVPRVAEMTFH
jgi:hypothetical protein